jgi:hypothetical protein
MAKKKKSMSDVFAGMISGAMSSGKKSQAKSGSMGKKTVKSKYW